MFIAVSLSLVGIDGAGHADGVPAFLASGVSRFGRRKRQPEVTEVLECSLSVHVITNKEIG
jgi:uncharacterized protein (DUF4213/DUF364 family)